jgi:L-lysine exporter family protein LysE/ArgO
MDIQAVLLGFGWGFILCFTFGPAFFALIQVSVEQSYQKGALLALGVVFADLILMFIAIFGTSFLPNISNFNQIISISGATLLLGMGFFSIFNKRQKMVYPKSTVGDFLYFFTKGTLLNLLNPTNFLFVVSTCTYLKGALKYNLSQVILFFGASLLATLLAELLIAKYASRIKLFADVQKVNIFNKIAGSIFIFVALRMLYHQFNLFVLN